MKINPIKKLLNRQGTAAVVRRLSTHTFIALLSVVVGLNGSTATGQTPGLESEPDIQGEEVLTRGPVHEAFASIVSYNPEPGLIVEKVPPEAINELPPDVRPEGDNVMWIPGYWAWDEERDDFLWVSGTWRALPPGREWVSGYWAATTQGHQWTSGYWADSTVEETTYLPEPPETMEVGPNIAAPSSDYAWTPGNWLWHEERYAWRPGYWNEGRSDWDWIPAHYVWTPRGYVFVEGYWDYSVANRGVLFAPAYLESNVYSRRGYRYSPTVVIDLGSLVEHLFLRPRYRHYYFGDYYAPNYRDRGYYSPFAYQSSRYGYDPVYSHQRWQHRHDREWEHRIESSYQYRRDHESARPPRTWAAHRKLRPGSDDSRQQRLRMASPLKQLARGENTRKKFRPVAEKERQQLAQGGQDIQKFRDHRRKLETTVGDAEIGKPGRHPKPTKAARPESPFVGRIPGKLPKTQRPPSKSPRDSAPIEEGKPDPQKPHKSDPDKEKPMPQKPPKAKPDKERPIPQKPRKAEPDKEKPTPQKPRKAEPDKQRPMPQKPRKAEPDKQRPMPQKPHRAEPDKQRPMPQKPRRAEPDKQRPMPEKPRKTEPDKERPMPQKPRKAEPDKKRPMPEKPRKTEPDKERPMPQKPRKAEPDKKRPMPEKPRKDESDEEKSKKKKRGS